MLSTFKNAFKRSKSLKGKNYLQLKETYLQEKLLGNMGRWEEADNNKKKIYAINKQVLDQREKKAIGNTQKMMFKQNKENESLFRNLNYKMEDQEKKFRIDKSSKKNRLSKQLKMIETIILNTQKKAAVQAKIIHNNSKRNTVIKNQMKVQNMYHKLFRDHKQSTDNDFESNLNPVRSYILENAQSFQRSYHKRSELGRRKSLDLIQNQPTNNNFKPSLSTTKFPKMLLKDGSALALTHKFRKNLVNAKKIIVFSVSYDSHRRQSVEYLKFLRDLPHVTNFFLTKIHNKNLAVNVDRKKYTKLNDLQKIYEILNKFDVSKGNSKKVQNICELYDNNLNLH
jgi:hypothetical protein